ncbi:hypothetical protein CBM2599_A120535 [Cupriavidus taiwanensis]|uniref:hypothetical protein n=1 Tax=Cupriavidus taiwanensis TaxID=164546 RepID=UPI000E1A0D55|nr:hypothetical protein [Cupriavidus taiwanensis]SOY79970.1 hypothetical protein CBM2599_A120535 [Cupriavidus taiwanensis]SOY81939.1 hypothetical protein CBM2600_A120557 [Cupriavidus taiwanensis]
MANAIKEEDGLQQQWYEEAKKMTVEGLPAFIQKLTTEYVHDYGTICYAVAAAGIAAMHAVNKSDQGGITGFQAGCITWELLRHWSHIEAPARITEFRNMLFPQYEHKFCAISSETWEILQEEAKKSLAEKGDGIHPNVRAHMESIVAGTVPFGYRVEAA